ncbi:MAG: hypothetical protein ACJ8FA_04290 [Xanthobacteraceae bacterium]
MTSPFDQPSLAALAADYHDRHRRTYGHDNRSEPVQIVSVRLAAVGCIAPLLVRDEPAPHNSNALKSTRQLWFRSTGPVQGKIYDRRRMPAGAKLAGPAVIESLESTILVPPEWQAMMNKDGFVLLTHLDPGSEHARPRVQG